MAVVAYVMSDRQRNNAKMRERWVSHWPGYKNLLVRYDFYMFLRRRLKICYLLSVFNLQSRFLAPLSVREGSLGLVLRCIWVTAVTVVHCGPVVLTKMV